MDAIVRFSQCPTPGCLSGQPSYTCGKYLRSTKIATILQELHADHSGMTRMKALAHSHVWWPKIDSRLELELVLYRDLQNLCRELRAQTIPYMED